jgi:hypothetical protein
MDKLLQVLINVILYAFLLWLLYENTIKEWDPWTAFVIGFVLLLSVVVSLLPGLHARGVSPGEYPYDE